HDSRAGARSHGRPACSLGGRCTAPGADRGRGVTTGTLRDALLIMLAIVVPTIFATLAACGRSDQLAPRRSVAYAVKPLTVQVIALDWKWLFIYPDEGVATVN